MSAGPRPVPRPAPRPVPRIAAMAPYALADLAAMPGGKPAILLAQNESLRPPSPRALAALVESAGASALYPDPDWCALRAAIAQVHGLEAERILCGAGSMELIAALAAAYLGPGDRALTTAHGYLFFRTATALAGAGIDLAPETALTVDPARLLAHVVPETRVVFLANPGNPTGTRIDRAALVALRQALRSDILLVIDEAYGEFADTQDAPVFDLVERGDTVVLRTFSKAHGLAGLRIGWGAFPPAIAATLRKVLTPNNVTHAAQAAATAAMTDQAYMRETVRQTARIRDRVRDRLGALGLAIPESHTNFLLLGWPSPEAAAAADRRLRSEGVVMRAMGGYGLGHCLRATIASAAEMTRTCDILTDMGEIA